MRLKVIHRGIMTPGGYPITETVNAATGEALGHVHSVKFEHNADELKTPRLVIELHDFEVEFEMETERIECVNCRSIHHVRKGGQCPEAGV